MSKIRVLIYRIDINNLQTRIVSFPDQEKFLKEVAFSIAVSRNNNTENSQRKHCPCIKYFVIYRPDLHNSNINTAQKSKMVRIEMYNLQTRLLQFKAQEKLKMYLMVRIELPLNENTLKGRKCLKYVFCNLKTFKLYNLLSNKK